MNDIEKQVFPLADAIKQLTGAHTVAVVLSVGEDKHLIGVGSGYIPLILRAAGYILEEVERKTAQTTEESSVAQKEVQE